MWKKCHNLKTQTRSINKFKVRGKKKYDDFKKRSFVLVRF